MYKEAAGSWCSRKSDELELVSRFLAPLCARDEAARNVALAAARTTVEGWLGGVGSPNNNWELAADLEEKLMGNRYESATRQAAAAAPTTTTTTTIGAGGDFVVVDDFFPLSCNETTVATRKTRSGDDHPTPIAAAATAAATDRYHNNSGSLDCVDGKTSNGDDASSLDYYNNHHHQHHHKQHEGSGSSSSSSSARIPNNNRGLSSSLDNDRRFFASTESLEDKQQQRGRQIIRINKSGRQKQQFDEDDEHDADTRVYGKSPKFDDDFSTNFELLRSSRKRSEDQQQYSTANYYCVTAGAGSGTVADRDKVVFNTLDGFFNGVKRRDGSPPPGTGTRERKLSAGQIVKRTSPAQDDYWSGGSARVISSNAENNVVVTPGDVGRMLNLGNALDGPNKQANKYLSLVSLHLPVILRLSVNCPFQNVRIKCAEIIQMIKVI